jgi:hypothetical protein
MQDCRRTCRTRLHGQYCPSGEVLEPVHNVHSKTVDVAVQASYSLGTMINKSTTLYTLQVIPAEIGKDSRGAGHLAIEVRAMQMGGDKYFHAFFPSLDEFMNRLGPLLCYDAFRWRQIENLLNQQDILSVAGPDAELAFTEEELKELDLKEAGAVRAA